MKASLLAAAAVALAASPSAAQYGAVGALEPSPATVAFPFEAPPLPADLQPRARATAPPADAAAAPAFAEYDSAATRFATGRLPSADEVMRQALLLETRADAEQPASRTRPLGNSGGAADDGDDAEDDAADDQHARKVPGRRMRDKPDDDPEDDTGADEVNERKARAPRFASEDEEAEGESEEEASGDASDAGSAGGDEDDGSADDGSADMGSPSEEEEDGSSGAAADDDSASGDDDDSASASASASGSPAATTTAIATDDSKDVRKCKGINENGQCVVRWPRGDQRWSVKTVPTGSLKEESSGSSEGAAGTTKIETSSSSSDDDDEEGLTGDSFVLSKIPEVASMQKQYRTLHKELKDEVAWRNKVRGVIRSYQNKVFNVNSHVTAGKARLAKMREEINTKIRAHKQQRLQYELKAAVEALEKLEGHSQNLNSRISDIRSSKNALRNTIGRIKLAMGRATNEDWTTKERFQELVLSKPPSKNEVAQAMRFAEANDEIKGHMSSLLEVLDRVQHPESHLTDEDRHEREAVKSLPALSLVEGKATATRAPADVAHARVEHHVYRAPRLPPADTSIVDQDVDPKLKDEFLREQFDSVMADTNANSMLE